MKGRLSQPCETSPTVCDHCYRYIQGGALTVDLDPKRILGKPVQTICINLKDKKKTWALDWIWVGPVVSAHQGCGGCPPHCDNESCDQSAWMPMFPSYNHIEKVDERLNDFLLFSTDKQHEKSVPPPETSITSNSEWKKQRLWSRRIASFSIMRRDKHEHCQVDERLSTQHGQFN